MIIHIDVKDREATYRSCGSDPVCGNTGDTVQFQFDAEWDGIEAKTARFIFGNRYYDVEFTGDSCPAPLFQNVTRVEIGVYAGEPAADEPGFSTTRAVVPYRTSVRCGYDSASDESGINYTNEAKGYAADAQAAAEVATQAAFSAEALIKDASGLLEDAYGLQEVGRATFLVKQVETEDESGAYIATWGFGNRVFSPQNGSMQLRARGDLPTIPEDHPFAQTLIDLLSAPVTRVILTHSDPWNVLIEKTLYTGLADGKVWDNMEMPDEWDATDWKVWGDEWHHGGMRLVANDNPNAPNAGYGPYGLFLQISWEMRCALSCALLENDSTSSCATMTIIAYH